MGIPLKGTLQRSDKNSYKVYFDPLITLVCLKIPNSLTFCPKIDPEVQFLVLLCAKSASISIQLCAKSASILIVKSVLTHSA